MSKVTYLFFGYACEYVLNPLFQYMQKLGYSCVELDLFFNNNALQIIKSLKNSHVVFINSAHLFYDKENFNAGYQYYSDNVISPLEVLDFLKPIKSIHVPHDLFELFHKQEIAWLDLFDMIFIPFDMPHYSFLGNTMIDVGWIKRDKKIYSQSYDNSVAIGFAFSDFEYHRRLGLEKTLEIWKDILLKNVTIKFPLWNEVEQYEEYFSMNGVSVFPCNANISDFIDKHHIILANGLSSVNAEAAYAGRLVINVVPSNFDSIYIKNRFKNLPNIQVMSINECIQYIDDIQKNSNKLPNLKSVIKPFDFELAIKNIVT